MKRHPFDPISFVFGLTFAVIGVVFLARDVDAQDIDPIGIALGSLIFFGLLAASVAFRWSRAATADEPRDGEDLQL